MGASAGAGAGLRFLRIKLAPTANAPSFDKTGESFPNHAREVRPRSRAASFDQAKRASAPILNLGPVAHEVCVAVGGDQIMHQGGVVAIMHLLRDHFASGTADSVYREVARLLRPKRAS